MKPKVEKLKYRKVSLGMWADRKFRALSRPPPNGQSMWQWLITGPRTTQIPGVVIGRIEVLAAEIDWPVDAFRKAFDEVSAKGMAKADFSAGFVWLPRGPEHNKPDSPNVIRSWRSTWADVPECDLKIEAWQTLKSFAKGWGKGWLEAFEEGCKNPSPNQEQEQEQEQDQEYVGATRSLNLVVGKRREGTADFDDSALMDAFAVVRTAYPHKAGRVHWALAEHHWRMRVDEGVTPAQLLAGVERYAAYVEAGGVSGPQFVLGPEKFFGESDKPWAQEWTAPASKGDKLADANAEAFADARTRILGGAS